MAGVDMARLQKSLGVGGHLDASVGTIQLPGWGGQQMPVPEWPE